jgi:hypothetical protein
MFDPDTQSELTASADLVALVQNKIYTEDAPQGTPAPYVCSWNVDGIRGGNLSEAAETKNVRVQIDIYGSTKKQARQIRDLVCKAIDDAGQGDVINDFLQQGQNEISRLYQWIVEVEYVVNR